MSSCNSDVTILLTNYWQEIPPSFLNFSEGISFLGLGGREDGRTGVGGKGRVKGEMADQYY